MSTNLQPKQRSAREGYVPVANARLYYREIGEGQPIIVLHGGPDFDHRYLLPDMDRLSDSFRLVYYDQRGRGRSAEDVRPEDVTIESEIEDLECLRDHFGLESAAFLGHSWGGLLAMEYAIRHPDRVSHLMLMNTTPASHDDFMLFRQERRKKAAADVELLNAMSSSAKYAGGDPEAVAEYYRVHFRATVKQPWDLERLIAGLRSSFTREGILKAWEIERRLMDEAQLSSGYTLFPQLEQLRIPTLVIHGDHDFISVECAARIARAIPAARFVLLRECGHFSYIERPNEVRKEIGDLLQGR